jgi:hypothetical protein
VSADSARAQTSASAAASIPIQASFSPLNNPGRSGGLAIEQHDPWHNPMMTDLIDIIGSQSPGAQESDHQESTLPLSIPAQSATLLSGSDEFSSFHTAGQSHLSLDGPLTSILGGMNFDEVSIYYDQAHDRLLYSYGPPDALLYQPRRLWIHSNPFPSFSNLTTTQSSPTRLPRQAPRSALLPAFRPVNNRRLHHPLNTPTC